MHAPKPWNVTTFPLDVQQGAKICWLLFFYFYMFFEKRCKKKLVHHNFEWVTPRWLDICRAALAVLKANHVTTGKEVNNVRQTKEWLFLFCSRRFYAPVITLWIVAIQLILCLPTTLHWVDLWVDRRLKLSDRSSSLLYRILMVMIWLWFQIFISSFIFFFFFMKVNIISPYNFWLIMGGESKHLWENQVFYLTVLSSRHTI